MISDVWTRENVFPVLGDYEACEDEAELLDEDEKQMMANKTHNALNDAEMTAAIWFKLKGYLKVK